MPESNINIIISFFNGLGQPKKPKKVQRSNFLFCFIRLNGMKMGIFQFEFKKRNEHTIFNYNLPT